MKYHPTANNDVVRLVEDEGAEAVVPDLLDFLCIQRLAWIIERSIFPAVKLNKLLPDL